MAKDRQNQRFISVPLSILNQNGVETSSITLGYILNTRAYNATKLDAAAGRLMKNWCICLPTGKLDGIKTHQFTSSVFNKYLDVPLTCVDTVSVDVFPRPNLKYFRDRSTPSTLRALSLQKAPIISIHISTLVNCTCVGISFPHGVFDATGMGQVIAGLDAELNGKLWVCPSFGPGNILSQKLEEHQNHTKRVSRPINFLNVSKFMLGSGQEHLLHGAVDPIVKKAKEKMRVESGGKEFVSTGDILMAWFLKGTQSDESSDDGPVSVSSAISVRSIFSPSNPAFSTYSHNAIMVCAMPLLTTSSVRTSSIVQLAKMHRSFLDSVRTPAFVQSYSRWMNSPENGGRVLPVRLGAHSWIFSNQVAAGFNKIDFGVEQAMFWVWTSPITLDHMCLMNMFKGGYVLEASMREVQWVAIQREVKRLHEEVVGI
ncbi:hypothetical protein BDZ94DRAFT_1282421 [Collybia nuda]|uniref:Uncharacterized protein n=1 Tax=Collybia nuda TaxID=64659 RepID=A0A9P6CF42_9AGAR|nr:hypothetical protein BDZ94DRAFT_1282421 [Collybia nuda]